MWPYTTNVNSDGFDGYLVIPRWATRIYYNCDNQGAKTPYRRMPLIKGLMLMPHRLHDFGMDQHVRGQGHLLRSPRR